MIKKKWMLGLAMAVGMMGMSAVADAKSYTRYCMAYATAYGATNVSTYFSMTVENISDACDIGCENEWNDYLKGNFTDYYKTDTDIISYSSLSKAKSAFYSQKKHARDINAPFHHARDFSCSGD